MNEKVNKLVSDTKKLHAAQHLAEVREMIGMLGHDPDEILQEDTDDKIAILMNAESLAKEMRDMELFHKDPVSGKYTVLAKVTALTVMTASLSIQSDFNIKTDNPVPQYTAVSNWLEIPAETLRMWWKNSKTIFREQAALGYSSIVRSTFKQIELIEKLTDGLSGVDINKLVSTAQGVNAAGNLLGKLVYIAKLLHTEGAALANITNQVPVEPHKDSKVQYVIPEAIEGVQDDNITD